jgi:type II secretion system protein C
MSIRKLMLRFGASGANFCIGPEVLWFFLISGIVRSGVKIEIKHVFGGIRIALVLILLWNLVQIFIPGDDFPDILGPDTATGVEKPAITLPSTKPLSAEVRNAEIIGENVFGMPNCAAASAIPSPESPAPDPEMISEKLGIRLIGIVSGNPTVARAIILDTESSITTVHKLGRQVKGATIKGITDDTVTVAYEGHDEVLRLANLSPKAQDQSNSSHDTEQAAATTVPVGQADPISERASYVERLLSAAQFSPHVEGDKIDGIQISGLDMIPEAKSFGFQEDDIIRVVNGQTLTSKQKAFQVFKKARSQPAIEIELVRDGKVKELSFKLR